MKEWNSQYNPFNSMKILAWREHFENCIKDNYLPPISCDTDPSNRCNFDCIWCNASDVIKNQNVDERSTKCMDIPEEHLLNLADFYKEWKILSTCVAGGGEPLMNRGINPFLYRLKENGVLSGVITNGSLIISDHIDAFIECCSWVGISMDAATEDTYIKVKGIRNKKYFDIICNAAEKLSTRIRQKNSKLELTFKFLIHPNNALEIYDAIKLAKELNFTQIHLRPVGWDNLSSTQGKEKPDFIPVFDEINKQMERGRELEDNNFKIYGITHKFNPDFTKKVNFSRCWMIPILPTFGADGNVHTCFDMRGRKDLILCSHYPDPREILKVWNTDFHRNMIRNIQIEKCPRCTFGPYNEIAEEVFIKDKMTYKFP